MLLPKFLSRKISPEKSLDFLSQKFVLRPALWVGEVNVHDLFESMSTKTIDIDRRSPQLHQCLCNTQPATLINQHSNKEDNHPTLS